MELWVKILLEILALLGSMLGGFWGVYTFLVNKIDKIKEDQDKRIERNYDRIDEVKDDFSEELNDKFVRKDMHELTIKGLEERTNDKFISHLRLFETELKAINKSMDETKDALKMIFGKLEKMGNHNGWNGNSQDKGN